MEEEEKGNLPLNSLSSRRETRRMRLYHPGVIGLGRGQYRAVRLICMVLQEIWAMYSPNERYWWMSFPSYREDRATHMSIRSGRVREWMYFTLDAVKKLVVCVVGKMKFVSTNDRVGKIAVIA